MKTANTAKTSHFETDQGDYITVISVDDADGVPAGMAITARHSVTSGMSVWEIHQTNMRHGCDGNLAIHALMLLSDELTKSSRCIPATDGK